MEDCIVRKALKQKDDFNISQAMIKRKVIIEKWLYEGWKIRHRQQKILDDENI
jgi:hypothetical protein